MCCHAATDYGRACEYLRRDVFLNNGMLEQLERNKPPVPKELFVAEEGGIRAIMLVTQFPHGACVDL